MDKSKMTGQSTDPQAELLAKLQKEMPEIFAEGKIDFSKFKATLGEDIVADGERYGLSWAGKSDCFRQIQETTTNTLKPCRDESVNFDDTGNLFIEGDNLQVMKVLQKSYYGKIKMIYIDPPYNTGNDFIYNDKFSQAKKEYLQEIGAIDELGNVVNAELYRQNTRDSGHFHSTWLNMMYPRLFLARNLLRQDGVIFVSIDDNEVVNLRAMMDEIFGEHNFVDSICWKKKYGGGAKEKYLVSVHEYILVYARNKDNLPEILVEFEEEKARRFYKYKDEKFETLGYYRTHPLEAVKSFDIRENLKFPVTAPDGTKVYPKRQWRWSKERFEGALVKGEVIFNKNKDGEWILSSKQYLNDENGIRRKTKAQSVIDDIFTQEGTREIVDVFGDAKIFSFPKPVRLLKKLIEIGGVVNNDMVFDFFAGSGTTAHAVAQLNAEDGGNRKWICVQLPEKCKDESEAAKAGYATIYDIAKERIRRANKKIADENKDKKLDLGFKVFKLEESNFKVWDTQIEDAEQLEQQMIDFLDNVREGATTEDLLYELILKSGKELNVPIEEKKADGQSYFRIGDGTIVICLADKLNKPLFEAIAKDKPEKIITLDRVFGKNDQLKTNILLQAEHAGVKEFKVI